MQAILWIVNFNERTLLTRADVEGSVKGLEEYGLFVNVSHSSIAQSLVQHEDARKVLIAYHPPESESTAREMPGDMVLPEVAIEYAASILMALQKERWMGGESSARPSVVSDLLEKGEIIVRAKCLRQEIKSNRPSSSYLFSRLAKIAATRQAGGSLQAPIEDLAREFEVDRDPFLLAWQGIASRLCALDLDLCALDLLLTKDRESGSERAAEYLREMLDGKASLWQASLSQFLKSEVEKIANDWGETGLPDLGPVQALLDALSAVATASPSGASTEDAKNLMRLVHGPSGFSQTLWQLSRYFSRLAQ